MKEISELTVLLRARCEMPAGVRLKNVEFEDGWNFVRTGSAQQLEKKIKNRGWHFIRVTDGLLRSGIGGTPQEAIDYGLKLALHHVSVFFNTVEIDRSGLMQYPWFFLARVSIHPSRIQNGTVVPVPDEARPIQNLRSYRWLPSRSANVFAGFDGRITSNQTSTSLVQSTALFWGSGEQY